MFFVCVYLTLSVVPYLMAGARSIKACMDGASPALCRGLPSSQDQLMLTGTCQCQTPIASANLSLTASCLHTTPYPCIQHSHQSYTPSHFQCCPGLLVLVSFGFCIILILYYHRRALFCYFLLYITPRYNKLLKSTGTATSRDVGSTQRHAGEPVALHPFSLLSQRSLPSRYLWHHGDHTHLYVHVRCYLWGFSFGVMCFQ